MTVFFTRRSWMRPANEFQIEAWQLDGAGGAVSIGTASGMNLDAIAVRPATPGQTSILLSSEVVGDAGLALGDYNADGRVDTADFVVWRSQLDDLVPAGTGADGDGNGRVDEADYDLWRSNFGARRRTP